MCALLGLVKILQLCRQRVLSSLPRDLNLPPASGACYSDHVTELAFSLVADSCVHAPMPYQYPACVVLVPT